MGATGPRLELQHTWNVTVDQDIGGLEQLGPQQTEQLGAVLHALSTRQVHFITAVVREVFFGATGPLLTSYPYAVLGRWTHLTANAEPTATPPVRRPRPRPRRPLPPATHP